MKKILLGLAIVAGFATLRAANITMAVASGSFSNPATWTGGVVPGVNDTIVLAAGRTLNIDVNATVARVVCLSGAASTTITILGTNSLTVGLVFSPRAQIVFQAPSVDNQTCSFNIGDGTVSCSDIIMANTANITRVVAVNLNNGTLTVLRDLIPNGAVNENIVTVAGTGTIYVGDDFMATGTGGRAGSFIPGNGTVVFDGDFGTGRQFVPPHNYNNIRFENSQRKFFTGGGTTNTIINGNVVCDNQVGAVLPLGQAVNGSGFGTVELGNPLITVKGTMTINPGAVVTDSAGGGRLTLEGLLTINGGELRADHASNATNTGEVIVKNGITITNNGKIRGSLLPNQGMELEFQYDPLIPGSANQTFQDLSTSPQFEHRVRDFVIGSDVTVTVTMDSLLVTDDILGINAVSPSTNGKFVEGTNDLHLVALDRFFDSGEADFLLNTPSTVTFGAGTKRPAGLTPGNIVLYNVIINGEAGVSTLGSNLNAIGDLTITGQFNPNTFNVLCQNLSLNGTWSDGNQTGNSTVSGTTTLGPLATNIVLRGDCIFEGNVTVDPAATFLNNGTKNIRLQGNPQTFPGFSAVSGGGTTNFFVETGANVTILGPISYTAGTATFTVEDNSDLTLNGALQITSDFTMNSSGTVSVNAPLTVGQLNLNAGVVDANNNTVVITQAGTGTNGSLSSNGGTVVDLNTLTFAGATSGTYYIIGSAPLTLTNVTADRSLRSDSPLAITGLISVPAGFTLTSNGNITLQATSTTQYGQLVPGSGNVAGDITIEKAIVNNATAGWRHLSFPTTAVNYKTAVQGIFLRGTESGLPSNFYNAWNYNDAATAGTGAWWAPNMTNVPATNFQRRAFAIYSDNSGAPFLLDPTISVTGPTNSPNSTQNFPIETWGAAIPADVNWNFIPNPFAFGLAIDQVLAQGGANVQPYLRYFNTATGTYSSVPTGSAAGRVLPPFQAFWLEVVTTGTLVMNPNIVGTTSTGNEIGAKGNVITDLFNLNVQLANGWKDELNIVFHAAATAGFDAGLEAPKTSSPYAEMVNLYAITSTGNMSWDAIPYDDNQVVAVAFTGGVFGNTYTLNPDFSQTTNGWQIYLKDLHTNTTTLLNGSNGYTFTHDANAPEQRFELLFTNSTLGDEELPATSKMDQLFVYQQGGNNFVHFPNSMMGGQATIEVMALSGQLISTQEVEISGATTAIALGDMPSAWYIVRISHPQGVLTHKVAK